MRWVSGEENRLRARSWVRQVPYDRSLYTNIRKVSRLISRLTAPHDVEKGVVLVIHGATPSLFEIGLSSSAVFVSTDAAVEDEDVDSASRPP